jgi:hypothetical protein
MLGLYGPHIAVMSSRLRLMVTLSCLTPEEGDVTAPNGPFVRN